MAITAARLQIVIEGNTDHAEAGLTRVGSKLGKMGGIGATALGVFAGNILTGAVQGISSLAQEALGAYASHERLGMALESLTARELIASGAAKNMTDALAQAGPITKDLQAWIQKLAIQSPFSQAGVADAFKTAQAYGFTAKEAQRLTGAMIDFAAGSGATESTMNTIALALGQIQAKGKLSGQEVLQLVNAGISVDRILADAFGKSTEEIVEMREKGLIPADEAIEAIVSTLERDFGGAAKRQSGTFAGLVASLSDIKEVGLREFLGGTFKAIQPYVQSFVDTLTSPKFMTGLQQIGTLLGEHIGKALEWLSTTGLPLFNQALAWLSANSETVKGVLIGVGAVLAGGLGIAGITSAIALLTNPVTLIIGLAGLLGAAWTNNWGGIRTTLTDFWETTGRPIFENLKLWLETNIPVAIETVTSFWTGTLQPALDDVWNFLSVDMLPIWTALGELFNVTIAKALELVSDLWANTLLPKLQDAWKFITESLIPKLKDLAGALDLGKIIQTIVDGIRDLASKIAGLKLPDWLTPGSPTPFETGLAGINKEMAALAGYQMPRFNARLETTGGIAGQAQAAITELTPASTQGAAMAAGAGDINVTMVFNDPGAAALGMAEVATWKRQRLSAGMAFR